MNHTDNTNDQKRLNNIESDDISSSIPITVAKSIPSELQCLLEKFGDDPVFMKEIVHIFIEDTPYDINRLQQSIEANNTNDCELIAHGLKGAARNFGFDDLGLVFLQLEHMAKQHTLLHARETLQMAVEKYEQIETTLKAYLTESSDDE